MDKGMVVQPYCSVIWGDINLSAYDNANSGEKDRIVQNVSLKYTKDDDAPTCDFDIVGTPDGFEVVQRMRESDDLFTETFDVELGFPHLPDLKMRGRYIFAGMDVTTGLDPTVNITVVSAMKSSFTDNKVTFTMEEEITLGTVRRVTEREVRCWWLVDQLQMGWSSSRRLQDHHDQKQRQRSDANGCTYRNVQGARD